MASKSRSALAGAPAAEGKDDDPVETDSVPELLGGDVNDVDVFGRVAGPVEPLRVPTTDVLAEALVSPAVPAATVAPS